MIASVVAAVGVSQRASVAGAGASDSEGRRARATAARIAAEWPLRGPGPVADLVRAVGKRLARTASPAPYGWSFNVVRDRAAAAFSAGGGRIYVSDGTITACHDESELAAIIAHEMGHELAGHFKAARNSHPGGLSQRLLRGLGATGAKSRQVRIGSVTQEISPEKESEADLFAVRILSGAGYDPGAAYRATERVEPRTMGKAVNRRRAKRLAALAEVLKKMPRAGRVDSQEFQRVKRVLEREEKEW